MGTEQCNLTSTASVLTHLPLLSLLRKARAQRDQRRLENSLALRHTERAVFEHGTAEQSLMRHDQPASIEATFPTKCSGPLLSPKHTTAIELNSKPLITKTLHLPLAQFVFGAHLAR
ncbi:hypothetical protein EDB86DRAFT_1927386 [Lactarius hatsudake]|nr:hypothetical protein EDB86DRAFT_1927386 [Lactarius hatsudake]